MLSFEFSKIRCGLFLLSFMFSPALSAEAVKPCSSALSLPGVVYEGVLKSDKGLYDISERPINITFSVNLLENEIKLRSKEGYTFEGKANRRDYIDGGQGYISLTALHLSPNYETTAQVVEFLFKENPGAAPSLIAVSLQPLEIGSNTIDQSLNYPDVEVLSVNGPLHEGKYNDDGETGNYLINEFHGNSVAHGSKRQIVRSRSSVRQEHLDHRCKNQTFL